MTLFVLSVILFAQTMIYVLDTCAVIGNKAVSIKTLKGDLFMVPEVYEECKSISKSKLKGIRVKSPGYHLQTIPLSFLYRYIRDFQDRVQKGLKIAEKFILDPTPVDSKIGDIRQEWKAKLRSGIVDTIADFETVMLASELSAILISNDEGMKTFAREMGVEIYILPT